MNRAIVRLFAVMVLLFLILIAWTSRWTVFDATKLDDNSLNKLSYYASLKIKRGTIYADNGTTVLAKSVKASGGTWKRTYPEGSLFAQTVGYAFPEEDQYAGIEQSYNDYLEGKSNALTSLFGSFNGTKTVGDDVYTTLDPKAQALAQELVQKAITDDHATSGSVVAIDPQTGAVKAMYSSPSYDDNDPSACKSSTCSTYFDALQGAYPPGSTFKLVTATAALDSGKATPDSIYNGPSPITIASRPLENDGDQSYSDVTLTDALTYSINTIFAPLGLSLGGKPMQEYMQRYGFYSIPPLDYPASQMSASGELFYKGSCGNHSDTPILVSVTSDCVDLGRTAIGQANLGVTPLQMAMVVSAIADDGKLMEPRLVSKVVNADGQVVDDVKPQEYDQVMKPKYARELQQMMRKVVEEGTGDTVNFPGLPLDGKTGTASTGGCEQGHEVDGNCPDGEPLDDAWFVGFPENDPKIAVAVELSDIPNGYGGTFAAPIAADVIKTLLAEEK